MKDVRQLKGLKATLKKMQADLDVLKNESNILGEEIEHKQKAIKRITSEIKEIEGNGSHIKISDHAIVRYFERVKGYDIEEIEEEILSKQLLDLVDKLGGNGTYPNGEFKVRLRNSTVITILPND